MNTENFTIEKATHPLNSKLKWKVNINNGVYPFKEGIYGHFSTKKKAMEVVVGLEKFVVDYVKGN